MKNTNRTKFIVYRKLSILVILVGLILLIYMIKVEDEPGALPLLLITLGTTLLILNRLKIKR